LADNPNHRTKKRFRKADGVCLEDEFESELDLARIEGRVGHPEEATVQIDLWKEKIDSIEEVEKFCPELEEGFLVDRNREVFDQ